MKSLAQLYARAGLRFAAWKRSLSLPVYSRAMPDADCWAATAFMFGVQFAVAHDQLHGPAYNWIRPQFPFIGWLLILATVLIQFGPHLPRVWHKFGWFLLGGWIGYWGIAGMLGNAGAWTCWATIPLSVACWRQMDRVIPPAAVTEWEAEVLAKFLTGINALAPLLSVVPVMEQRGTDAA